MTIPLNREQLEKDKFVSDAFGDVAIRNVSTTSGVPADFTRQTSNGVIRTLNKGQLNKLRVRPQILNEHVESSREVQGVVDSSTIVGQIFKASQPNINGIMLTLESAAGVEIDTFESYANSAALQVEWVETDANDKALLDTTIVKTGTKSMNLPMSATVSDEWVNTVTSTDYTAYTFSLDFYQTKSFSNSGMKFFIGDGTNTKSIDLVVDGANSWNNFDIHEQTMVEDGGTTDIAAITKIGFRLDNRSNNTEGYVDNITATPEPGQVGLKLWDMGTSIPSDGVTSIDDGTQYTEIGDRGFNGGGVVSEFNLELQGGKRLYSVKDFACGTAPEISTNTLLNSGNYYALTLNYVDTDVSVFGADSSFNYQYYNNGYSFTTPDESTAITAVGTYNDCMFGIFSTQDVYINTLLKVYDNPPGTGATESVFVEDENMSITSIVAGDFTPTQELLAEFKDRVYPMANGSKFEIYYNDDFTDSVTTASILIGYMYKPPTVNG